MFSTVDQHTTPCPVARGQQQHFSLKSFQKKAREGARLTRLMPVIAFALTLCAPKPIAIPDTPPTASRGCTLIPITCRAIVNSVFVLKHVLALPVKPNMCLTERQSSIGFVHVYAGCLFTATMPCSHHRQRVANQDLTMTSKTESLEGGLSASTLYASAMAMQFHSAWCSPDSPPLLAYYNLFAAQLATLQWLLCVHMTCMCTLPNSE